MKKRIISVLFMTAMVFILTSCGGLTGTKSTGQAKADHSKEGDVINFLVYQDTMKNVLNAYYPEVKATSEDGEYTYLKDGTTIHWIVNEAEAFQYKLDDYIKVQYSVPADQRIDIVDLEGDYMKKYLEMGICVPLSDIGITPEDMKDQYQYTKDAITRDGEICGTSMEVAPGLFAYRRSIAKDVLGTDDPDEVQKALADWDSFDEVAEKARQKGYYMLSGFADAYRVFANNTSAPWVSDDKTVKVDPAIMEWVEMTKRYTDMGYNNRSVNVFTEKWMNDQKPDAKVFGFFYSTWGVNFTLVSNAGEEGYGDWAVCKGPMPFYWGASWLTAMDKTDNPEHIRDIMNALTCNREVMKNISLGINTFVNNSEVMTEIASDPDCGSDFLKGQNHLALFNEVAPTLKLDNLCAYDQGCTLDMIYTFTDYYLGNIPLDTAKKRFEIAIKDRYPNITSVVWP